MIQVMIIITSIYFIRKLWLRTKELKLTGAVHPIGSLESGPTSKDNVHAGGVASGDALDDLGTKMSLLERKLKQLEIVQNFYQMNLKTE